MTGAVSTALWSNGCNARCRFEAETNGDYLRILDVSLDPIVEPEADGLQEEGEEDEEDPLGDEEDTSYGGPVRAKILGLQLSELGLQCTLL